MNESAADCQLTETELQAWFSSSLGQALRMTECELISEWAADLFGYQLLEVSLLNNDLAYLDRCVIKSKVHISPLAGAVQRQLQLRAMPEQLPVAADYVDAVILPHTLDFATDPRQVLREAERVLIPEGRLIVCGFNPFSLWGVRRWWPGAGRHLPWSGEFISYTRLQDWFSLLGFDVERTATRMIRPPLQQQQLLEKLGALESVGQRWLPWLAGVYVVQAVKRVSTVTPVRPRWQLERKLRNTAVEPGSSMHSNKQGK